VRSFRTPGSARGRRQSGVATSIALRNMPAETSEDSTLGKIKDALQAFYPLIVSLVLTPFVLALNLPWIGIALGAVLFSLKRTWWTCIFGIFNAMAIVAMMVACVVLWATNKKSEASQALHPAAVGGRLEFKIPSPPWKI